MFIDDQNRFYRYTRFLFILCISTLFWNALGDDETHHYQTGEEVTVWMNKVGPYHNPQETYSYYSLPFCRPEQSKEMKHKDDGLGSVLEGNDLTDSGFLIKFNENQKMTKICDLVLDEATTKAFLHAVANHYWYQMYLDDLPMWGMVGEFLSSEDALNGQKEQGFIYTHKDFSISYNGDQIIQVNLTSENPKALIPGLKHSMTLSVNWKPTTADFHRRFDRYLDFDFFEHQIHWFSIFNSFMMVVFLCGLVALILMRTLKNDYARYTNDEDELDLNRVVDESGWKQVHGDVFRSPPYLAIFSALIGIGHQLFVLCFCLIFVTIMASMYDERGMMINTIVVLYCLTSVISGYVGSSYYKKSGGEEWKKCMILTAGFFPGVSFCIAFLLNFVAVYYDSLIALPFTTMVTMAVIWLCVSCPLVVLGTFLGRSNAVRGDFPCRVNAIRRPIPDGYWYTKPPVMALFGGILPFGSIFIEMYFIFTSFWNYKFYYVYGFMLLVYVILIIVTICVTIVSTYFLLNAEDYRWQWTSFFSAGSTAFYVYLYAFYYFFTKTRMTGLLQTCFYFGYMGMFCLGLFILCGTIGFCGSDVFVRRIYQYIKSD